MAVETSVLASAFTSPKCVDRPHYEVTIPNEIHQFDLLYMPSDTLDGTSTSTSTRISCPESMSLQDIKL